ncbi:MAG: hypothetical protein HY551_07985 [Elusimicrobia bacterium]|nr:hypothetical protein [Elusimicrobiota bacterium]
MPRRVMGTLGVTKVHFIGIAGSGVSALAQFHVMGGGRATGSDRAFDRGEAAEVREKLGELGVRVFPQDGSALDGSHAYAVASAALEEENPEMRRARELSIEVRHRADELARHVSAGRAIAVAGTSGKSTVAAMAFEILDHVGLSPSIIAGGELLALKERGLMGNALRGRSDLLVVEADESDGTLARYRPWLGVLLNVSKDHKEVAELKRMFADFRGRCGEFAAQALAEFEDFMPGSLAFRVEAGGPPPRGVAGAREEWVARDVRLGPEGSRFSVSASGSRGEARFSIPVPGLYNVENALAAAATCGRVGVSLEAAAAALARFKGVSRRFERVGMAGGIEVVSDYAHNPVKLEAALRAAHLRARRVLAVFQLHGYAPARFLKNELIESLSAALSPEDVLWMPEIFYAGGTVRKDISADDIVRAVAARGRKAFFAADRGEIVAALVREARPGDLVLVMGARDPGLPGFARRLLAELGVKY